MACIIEHAGGLASTGLFRGGIVPILDLVPTDIHEKCPVIVGDKDQVEYVLNYYK